MVSPFLKLLQPMNTCDDERYFTLNCKGITILALERSYIKKRKRLGLKNSATVQSDRSDPEQSTYVEFLIKPYGV